MRLVAIDDEAGDIAERTPRFALKPAFDAEIFAGGDQVGQPGALVADELERHLARAAEATLGHLAVANEAIDPATSPAFVADPEVKPAAVCVPTAPTVLTCSAVSLLSVVTVLSLYSDLRRGPTPSLRSRDS